MRQKRAIASFELILMLASVFAFASLLSLPEVLADSTLSDPSVCCEKTDDGAYCLNLEDEDDCDSDYRDSPTSCESTSYCKLGTCYDSEEGICMENTPQIVCENSGGTWDERELTEVPQCQLGCCIIADQAAYVSLVRCKRLSTLFGVENNYLTSINSEVECIAEANSQDMGACVYESAYERVCEFTTRDDCNADSGVIAINGTEISSSSEKRFYEDYLCSAEELNTICAKQTSTTCEGGKVYWVDSCGNLENVYSSDKDASWNNGRVAEPDEICDLNDGSDADCGNCEYLLGSRCAEWEGFIGGPSEGDYYCQATGCEDREGNERTNGESWCVTDGTTGNGADAVGSRYFREVCLDGEVIVEPCADYRNEVCISTGIDTGSDSFEVAGCVVNRWQDCTSIKNSEDCLNTDKRDCMWLTALESLTITADENAGSSTSGSSFSNPTANAIAPITGNALFGDGDYSDEDLEDDSKTNRPNGVCVPNYPPGFDFWSDEETSSICAQASARCVVTYEESLLGGEKIVDGAECLDEEWAIQANKICTSLGDCGAYVNYQDEFTDDGYKWIEDGESKEFSPNSKNTIARGFTAALVGAISSMFTGGVITGNDMADIDAAYDELGGAEEGLAVAEGKEEDSAGSDDAFNSYMDEIGEDDAIKSVGLNSLQKLLLKRAAQKARDEAANNANVPSVTTTEVSGYTGWAGTPIYAEGSDLSAGTYYGAGDSSSISWVDGTTSGSRTLGDSGIAKITTNKDGSKVLSVTTTKGDGTSTETVTLSKDSKITAQGSDGVNGPAGTPSSQLSKFFQAGGGSIPDAFLTGLQWAFVAYGVGYTLGSMIGFSEDNTQALSTSLAAGAFMFQGLSTWTGAASTTGQAAGQGIFAQSGAFTPAFSFGVGLAVAAIVFIAMYKETSQEIVTFECKPWQAPTGVSEAICEECNDGDLPCSEYRCRSLGASCELVNEGTGEEKCVNVNPRDVTPPTIEPNYVDLTSGYEYTDVKSSPPGPGFKITSDETEDGCIPAFTSLEFGVTTSEPAQCKIDYNSTSSFEDMLTYMGGNNLYNYNHTEIFRLPGTDAFEGSNYELSNGNEFTFFIRCQDTSGNSNEAEYAVRFCVEDGPDTTAPVIEATSVLNGGCVAEDTNSAIVDFYTNEPADCRWSTTDQSYSNMQNEMECTSELYQINAMQLYTCTANLTGIARDQTNYYVRCMDQPDEEDESNRNENKESLEFSLEGSSALKIKNLLPNGTIFGGVSPSPVELYVESYYGCNEGQAICYYSLTGDEDDYIMFYDTNNEDGINTQRLDLESGEHEIYIQCIDAGGNLAEDTIEFDLDIDTTSPVVARVYEEDQMVKIVTVRDSECAYSLDNCDFTIDEGTLMPYANSTIHVAEWNNEETFYIKCRDEFRNEEADCSVVVKPSKDFL